MKVLWLTDFFPQSIQGEITGGVEARCFYVSNYLKKNGVSLKIIARKTSGSTWHPPSLLSIPERLVFTAKSLIEGLKSDFDLVEGTNAATFPAAWILGTLKRKPIVFWYPDVFIGSWVKNAGLVAGLIGELSERWILTLPVTKYIAISNQTKDKLVSHGIPKDKIEVIYCGIDVPKISKTPIKYDICAVSRMLPYKRLDDLIEAAKILNIKVAILGRGPENEKLRKLANKNVTFINYLPKHKDVLKLISSAKVFCHPSIVEGFGISILEAMALGKPAVLSDIPVLHETTGGKGVLFFQPKNVKDLVTKLKKLLTDSSLYKRKSKEAIKRAHIFNWKDISTQTLDLYKDVTKLKICMTTDSWRPVWGGGQEHILQISKRLQKNYNCKVDIVAPNLKGNKIPDEPNIRRLGLPFIFPNLIGRIVYMFSAFFYLLFHNYDIYHFHGSEAILLPLVKLFKPKSKVVYTVHGAGVKMLGPSFINWFNLPKRIWEAYLYNYSFDILMTAAKATIKKETKAKKFLVTGNGVDVAEFDRVKGKRSTKTFKLIWIGRENDPIKGVKYLRESFRTLKKKYPNMVLELVSKKFGREKIHALKSANLYVLPSLSEGLPLTLLEAMAAKLPIVATDVGDCKMLLHSSGAGTIVPPGDSNALSKGAEDIYRSKNRDLMGQRGYLFVKKKYTWDNVTKQIYAAYKGM